MSPSLSLFFCLAWGFGDPHIRTLDGKEFTFNGVGEYLLFKSSMDTFVLQGRMALVENSTATVYSAFAAAQFEPSSDFSTAQLNSSAVHIELTVANKVRVLVCCYALNDNLRDSGSTYNAAQWRDVTEDVEKLDNTQHIFLAEASLTRPDNISIVAVFSSGISVRVEVKKLMSVVVSAPDVYKGNTKGLLGLWDDDINNDFTGRSGTTISINSTDREIHTLSQTCTDLK